MTRRTRVGVTDGGVLCPHPVRGRGHLRRVKRCTPGMADLLLTGKKPAEAHEADVRRLREAEPRQNSDISRLIASGLERAGIEAIRRRKPTVLVDMVTLEEINTQNYNNINLIPAVFYMNTRNMRKELSAYMDMHKIHGSAFVIGNNWVTTDQISQELKYLSRTISRMAKELRTNFGADIFFANSEINFKSEDDNGKFWYHIHAHILIDHNRMKSSKYKNMIEFIKNTFKKRNSYVHCNSLKANSGRAISNYVTKFPVSLDNMLTPDSQMSHDAVSASAVPQNQPPASTVKCGNIRAGNGVTGDAAAVALPDAELATLATILKRVRFLRPSGGFLAWRRQFCASESSSRGRLEGVPSDNGNQDFMVVSKRRRKRGSSQPKDTDIKDIENTKDMIVARLPPMARHGWYRPALIIAHRSDRPIRDVLHERGFLAACDAVRSIYNARVPVRDRLPILSEGSIGRIPRVRIETINGVQFAISIDAEDLDRTTDHIMMKQSTTITVPTSAHQTVGGMPRRPSVANVTATPPP